MRREGDIVLIYYEEHPAVFARIESIEPDIKRGWYHVTLMLLTIPTHSVTWILRESYIEGSTFEMGGMSMRLEEVKGVPAEKGEKHGNKAGKIIPFKKT